MKLPCLLVAFGSAALAAHAALVTEPVRTFTVGYDLADIANPGAVFQQTISDSTIVSLTNIRVGLHLVGRDAGGFASELVVSLNKDLTTTSILLNRVGLSGTNPIGFGYDGWNIALTDGGAGGDVHLASLDTGILTGEFSPDGRTSATSPLQPYPLGVFDGSSGNGNWHLSVADLASGGTMRLEGWSLTLTGHTSFADVPETSPVAAGLLLLAWLAHRLRRFRRP